VHAVKKHWLRGVLLGVSVARLLGGAVAMAQGMTATVDQDCFECWPGPWGPEAGQQPTADYVLQAKLSGLDSDYDLCNAGYLPGSGWEEECFGLEEGMESFLWSLAAGCDAQELCVWLGDLQGPPVECFDSGFGQLRFKFWQTEDLQVVDGPVWAYVAFAEECEPVEEEFVPEPGTVMLLGSGLMGLAGYATLRWRSRQ
jgi:hypothetical protein